MCRPIPQNKTQHLIGILLNIFIGKRILHFLLDKYLFTTQIKPCCNNRASRQVKTEVTM